MRRLSRCSGDSGRRPRQIHPRFDGIIDSESFAETLFLPVDIAVGNSVSVMIVAVISEIVGTWIYGWLRLRLPH
jgi:hypothetical protein